MRTIADKNTEDLRALADRLGSMSDVELWDAQTAAAEDFTAYTLHAKLPPARRGASDDFARRLRTQRADAAEALWLAADAELSSRRDAATLARAIAEGLR